MLALRLQAVEQLDRWRAAIGLGARAAMQCHQRVGLVDPVGQDAARPMIFERPADDADAIREKGRRQRSAREALERQAIEAKVHRLAATDQTVNRKSAEEGKSVSVRVDLDVRGI